jgi:hypothetical protein
MATCMFPLPSVRRQRAVYAEGGVRDEWSRAERGAARREVTCACVPNSQRHGPCVFTHSLALQSTDAPHLTLVHHDLHTFHYVHPHPHPHRYIPTCLVHPITLYPPFALAEHFLIRRYQNHNVDQWRQPSSRLRRRLQRPQWLSQ